MIDGVGRLLLSSDIAKLKSKGKADVGDLEERLEGAWKFLESQTLEERSKHKHFGRVAIRGILFILNKKQLDGKSWKSLEEIFHAFTASVNTNVLEHLVKPADRSSSSTAESALVDLKQASDPVYLALAKVGDIKVGSLVVKKEEKKDILFKVDSFVDDGLMVQPLSLLGPVGPPRKMSVQDIGKLKPYKGICPEVIDSEIVEKHFPTTQCVEEEAKLQCWLALFELYNEQDVDSSHVGFCTTGELFAKDKVAKHDLLFVPITDSASKISIVAAVDPKVNASWAHWNGKIFKILPAKPLKQKEDGTYHGTVVPYWLCKPMENGQMVPKKVSSKGIEFTCFTNNEAIKKEDLIGLAVKHDDAEKGKKRKAS